MAPRTVHVTQCRLIAFLSFPILILIAVNIIAGVRLTIPDDVHVKSYSYERINSFLERMFYVPGIEEQEGGNATTSASVGKTGGPSIVGQDDEDEDQYNPHDHKWQFAENVAAELSVHSGEMIASGQAFAAEVTSRYRRRQSPHQGWEEAFRECELFSDGSRLTRHDYSHRKKRAGEHRTEEYFEAMKGIVPKDSFWTYSPRIPVVLNHFPIALTDDPSLNISVPFGSWKSVFYPVDDFMSHHQEADIPKRLRPPQVVEATPPLFSMVVPKGVISQGHLVTCDGHVLTAGGCIWDFSFKPSAAQLTKAKHVTIGIPLCDKWCNGYYHFTHEHLPRLALVHALLVDPTLDARLVLSHAPNGFVRQFLFDVLGIAKNRVMSGGHTAADIAVYPMPQRCGNTFTHLLHMMRALVHSRLSLSPIYNVTFDTDGRTRRPHLLFAERAHLSRMPTNFYDLKTQLMDEFKDRLVFSTTDGDTNARDQIGRFYKADIVLGPHGANLANIMWMRRGMHVVELSSAADGNMCYYATAGRAGLIHHLLLHGASKDGRYTLEYSLFRQHVAAALKAVEESIAEEQIFAN